MKTSRYFASLIETYRADMQGLAVDFEGHPVLERRLNEKRAEFSALLPIAVEMPELAAPALHRAFSFHQNKDAERLLLGIPATFPGWESIQSLLTIQSWAQPLVAEALQQKGGDTFLTIAALLDHAYLVQEHLPVPEPENEAGEDDEREMLDSDDLDGEDLGEAGGAWLEQQGFDRRETE